MEMFMDRNVSFTRGLCFSWNDDEPLVIISPLVSQGADNGFFSVPSHSKPGFSISPQH
jgi:hypothetical protein